MNLPLTNNKGQKLQRKYVGVFPPKTTMDKKAYKAYQNGEPHFSFGTDKLGRKQFYVTPQEYYYA